MHFQFQLNLIEGLTNDVSIIYVDNLNSLFVQQPTHPTYPALSRLHQALKGLYEQPVAPHLLRPFNSQYLLSNIHNLTFHITYLLTQKLPYNK